MGMGFHKSLSIVDLHWDATCSAYTYFFLMDSISWKLNDFRVGACPETAQQTTEDGEVSFNLMLEFLPLYGIAATQ